jgi:Protein of unknown function (DUF3098)
MSKVPKVRVQPVKSGAEEAVVKNEAKSAESVKAPVKTRTASALSASKPSVMSGGFWKMLSADNTKPNYTLLFDKQNYMWMLIGIAMIFIGFLLMAGGKSANPHEFHYEEIYSFRRITLAPIVILAGFAVEVYAIMKLPKDAGTDAYVWEGEHGGAQNEPGQPA